MKRFALICLTCALFCGCASKPKPTPPAYQMEYLFVRGAIEYSEEIMPCLENGSVASVFETYESKLKDLIYFPPTALPLKQAVMKAQSWGAVEAPNEVDVNKGEIVSLMRIPLGIYMTAFLSDVEENGFALDIDFNIKYPPRRWEKSVVDSYRWYSPVYESFGVSIENYLTPGDGFFMIPLKFQNENTNDFCSVYIRCSQVEDGE